MSDQTQTVDATVTEIQPDQPAPIAQLQLSDIASAAQIIQLAAQRGAFRAEEFTLVGGCYERVIAFLKASGALQPAPTSDTAEKTAE
jgi:hypothetical protein